MSKVMYFGHPINVYSTPLEDFLLEKISAAFPDWYIENPNQPKHDAGYAKWRDTSGKGMDYYFKVVLPQCHAGIFLPFRDGAWGMGVYGEAEFLFNNGLPIYQITHEGIIADVDLSQVHCLTVAETKERIRMPDGTSRPF